MKTITSKKSSLVLGLFSLALMSCSSHSELDDVVNPTHDDVATISISVKAPISDAVVISKAATVQTVEESTINNMTVYLFNADPATLNDPATPIDAKYKYHSQKTFTTLLDAGKGAKGCIMPISSDLFGNSVKVAIVANDVANFESLTPNATTLEDFKKALASANVTTNSASDALVGNGTAGFPMSAITEAQEFGVYGATFEANLTRNVARLEIFNNVPNLTIKGVSIANANKQSCIFAGDAAALNVPTVGLTKISLNPLQAFVDTLGKGLAYKSGANEVEIKNNNTYTFAYIYEQDVTATLEDSPEVKVTYDLAVEDQNGTTIIQKPGSVTVRFEKTGISGKEPVPVKRNHRYTIQLGEGKNVSSGFVNATFTVVDWAKGDEITPDLTPQLD